MIWPLFGRTGRGEADHRRERPVAEARGEHDLAGAERAVRRVDLEDRAARRDPRDVVAGPVVGAGARERRCESRAAASADCSGRPAGSTCRRRPRTRPPAAVARAPRDRAPRCRSAGIPAAPAAPRGRRARCASSSAPEADVDAAGLRERDVDPRLAQQLGGEARPLGRRTLRPRAVGWQAPPLPLHPDQPEVAARGAMRVVGAVERGELRPQRAQPEGDRRADQAAADHGDLEAAARRHVAHPAKRSTEATSSPKSAQP